MKINQEYIINTIDQLVSNSPESICVYWLCAETGREELRCNLAKTNIGIPFVPIVLRHDLFDNPNSIPSDIIKLFETYKNDIIESYNIIKGNKVVILIISKVDLEIPQDASPVSLPNWFPVLPNNTVMLRIESLTNQINAPLNAPEVQIDRICELLHELEITLLLKLRQSHSDNHNCSNSFFDLIRDHENSQENYKTLLENAILFNHTSTPSGYRPSARTGKSFITRLLRLISKSSPDQLNSHSKKFSCALGINVQGQLPSDESLFSILLRSTNQENDPTIRFTRNVLMVIFAASQLVIASAHHGDYPHQNVNLLRQFSYNIRINLINMMSSINTL